MRLIKWLRPILLLAAIWLGLGSWGFLVHKTVHQLAVYKLPARMAGFFYQNMDYLVNNAPRPDTRRNQDSTEATKHFIDLEMYGADAALRMPAGWDQAVQLYTRDSLLKYGYVPYHVLFMKEKLVQAFRSGNKDSILFYATDMGHYIGDANVPLHTTVNYDGQLTNQRGLHSLWESTVPELDMNNWNLYSARKARYLKHPDQAIWAAVRQGAALVPALLAAEQEVSKRFSDAQKYRVRTSRGREIKSYSPEFGKAYAEAVKTEVNAQLLRSAELIADFWYSSWVDAGRPDLNALQPYSKQTKRQFRQEKQYYKDNLLIPDKLLLSRKTEARESE
ncbi:MAG: hypothetical protein JO301_13320 [Chitinophagaceae bacterium]|nr:hypothetical protein [Chitinophagaceae bacterium]